MCLFVCLMIMMVMVMIMMTVVMMMAMVMLMIMMMMLSDRREHRSESMVWARMLEMRYELMLWVSK